MVSAPLHRWLGRGAARRLLCVVSGLAIGLLACHREQPAPAAESRPRKPLPPPQGLFLDLSLAQPTIFWNRLRSSVGGPVTRLPSTPELALGALLGLDPMQASSLDLREPLVGAVLEGPKGRIVLVLGVHVENGPEIVAKLSTGSAPSHHTEQHGDLILLIPESPERSEEPLGVIDDVLLSGPAWALRSAGAYLARSPARAPIEGGLSLVAREKVLRTAFAPALRGLWEGARQRLLESAHGERAEHGRPADFAEPMAVLSGVDRAVAGLLAALESTAELRARLFPDASGLRLEVELAPEPKGAARELVAGLPPGSPGVLGDMPVDTAFALSISRGPERPEGTGPGSLAALLGDRLSAPEARKVDEALADLDAGRGDRQILALLSNRTLLWSGAVTDQKRLARGLSRLPGLCTLPAFSAPLTQHLGRPRVVQGRVRPTGGGPALARDSLFFTPSPAQRKSGLEPRRMEIVSRVDPEHFDWALAPELEAALGALAQREGPGRLRDSAPHAEALAALGDLGALALLVDLDRLKPDQDSSGRALITAGLGRCGPAACARVVTRGAAALDLWQTFGP